MIDRVGGRSWSPKVIIEVDYWSGSHIELDVGGGLLRGLQEVIFIRGGCHSLGTKGGRWSMLLE